MADTDQDRGVWGSKLGFVFAAAGSAIGLGNIWRFPFVAGQNGGAAFVLLYVLFILIIGLPVLISELTIGRNTERNPVGAYNKLFPKSGWKYVGGFAVLTSTLVLSFYAVIAGFAIGYFIKTLMGDFSRIESAAQFEQAFADFTANPFLSIGLTILFLVLTGLIVKGGVSAGLEKWTKTLMPILFLLLILLALRSVTLPGAVKGLEFYLKPDFSKITITTFGQALGQALFSLGLGAGTMITYGSYLQKREKLVSSAASVCFFDTLIAILAGLIVFPALFAMGMDPAGGPGLVFVVLPSLFGKIPGGMVFGAGIFLLISLAALTTTISMLEIPVSYLIDEKKWSRKKATLRMGLLVFLISIPSALSMGASGWLSSLPYLKTGFLDVMNIIVGNYCLTIGAFFVAVFVGYKWGIKPAIAEIEREGRLFPYKKAWAFLIRFVCPVFIIIILGYIIITKNYF